MNKSLVLALYGVVVYILLKKWYGSGGSGMPPPKLLAAPTYLYGILLLSSEFLGGIPIILALALTVSLYWQASNSPKKVTKK